jgi:hypothetical protein
VILEVTVPVVRPIALDPPGKHSGGFYRCSWSQRKRGRETEKWKHNGELSTPVIVSFWCEMTKTKKGNAPFFRRIVVHVEFRLHSCISFDVESTILDNFATSCTLLKKPGSSPSSADLSPDNHSSSLPYTQLNLQALYVKIALALILRLVDIGAFHIKSAPSRRLL